MKIGIISDTHGFLDPKVPGLFSGVAHILHAGDIGREGVINELRAIAPVTAVAGNVDVDLHGYRQIQRVTIGDRKFFIVHIGRPSDLAADLRRMIFGKDKPDMVVFGHSHLAERMEANGVVFFNPGSAGKSRFGRARTVAIADIPATCGIETQWIELD